MDTLSVEEITVQLDAPQKQRLDSYLAGLLDDLSRARIQALIKDGCVCVDGSVQTSPSYKIVADQQLRVEIPAPEEALPQAQDIPLDILYEDDALLVINKQAGLVVHPGAGNHDGTLVNALLYHCGDSLSGIGGVRRPGIVHRLDKDTSGVMLVAKNDKAHKGLARQLADRSLSREYLALVVGEVPPGTGKVDVSIGRHATHRTKMAANVRGGRHAVTHYKLLKGYKRALSLLSCKLDTGRTHQIRVHMDHIGFPLLGDPLYRVEATKLGSLLRRAGYDEDIITLLQSFPRQALHSAHIRFIHPVSGEEMQFSAPMPSDLDGIISVLNQ